MCQYIKSTTNTQSVANQYIQTTIKPKIGLGFYVDFYTEVPIGLNQSPYGAILGSRHAEYQLTTYTGADGQHGMFGYGLKNGTNNRNDAHLIEKTQMKISFVNNVYRVNGVNYNITKPDSCAGTQDICIFALNSGGTITQALNMELYRLKFYDGTTLINDLVPCLNDQDESGLYDIKNKVFYGNAGSGNNFSYKIIQ